MQAVFARVYHLDPRDLTLRRFWVLLNNLTPGDWPDQGSPGSWSREAAMLADLIDLVQWNTWTLAAVNSKRRPAKPKPYPRPWKKREPYQPRGFAAAARDLMREQEARRGH